MHVCMHMYVLCATLPRRTLLRPLRPVLPEWIEIPNQLALVPTEYKIVVPFFILIAVLGWRPTGIFRGRLIK